jgi:alpha-mannosidase
MNLALRSHKGASAVEPLIAVEKPNVIVESVKLAEDETGDLIVRLYEGLGTRTTSAITANFEYDSVALVDLLESRIADQSNLANLGSNAVELQLRPFKLATLRFARK